MYKVLLVDDDVHILNANETYLARLGYQITARRTGNGPCGSPPPPLSTP